MTDEVVKKIKTAVPSVFKYPEILSGMSADTSILVGFSGGADSSALLHMLARYSYKTGAKIYAAHINHGIRGEEADRDEAFCKDAAKKLGVEFFSLKADVPKIAKESKESIESAARRVRYQYFATLMQKHGIPLLATAHNADDNIETLIFNLARGAGLGGMCGIPESRPCENGLVIRPILGMEKSEILDYCAQNGIDFVTDSTNLETDYTRNKIRAQIIPVLRQINPGAVKNAYRMTETLREDSLCLESMSRWFAEDLGENFEIETEKICGSPAAVVNRALIRLYDEISEGGTLEQSHINSLRLLAQRAVPHSSVSLPSRICATIEDGKLCFRKACDIGADNSFSRDYDVILSEGETFISQTNSEIVIGNSQNTKNIYKKSILLSIDFDKIKGKMRARGRREGDKIRMNGMSKSVKKLMCDKKIPLQIRSRIPVIYDDDGIVAIPAIGVCDKARAKSCSCEKNMEIRFYLY